MSTPLPYFAAAEVDSVLDYPSLIAALRECVARGATVPLRHVHELDRGRVLLMPAWREGGALGVKIVTVFPGNRARGLSTIAGIFVLADAATGHPRALLDGASLTLRRTAGVSALASSYLSRTDARTLLVLGAGAMAPQLARAHCAVRRFDKVLVWSRAAQGAEKLVPDLAAEGLPAAAAPDLRAALPLADVVCSATSSREPLVNGALIKPGTHVDLVGGFTQDMREGDDELIARAELFVDTFDGALTEAGDLVQPIEKGLFLRDRISAGLADLCSGKALGRTTAREITLFKSVGSALFDLCAAQLAFDRLSSA